MLRIAIVVHGRFHMFDLARELNRLGHDVCLFTNYPGWMVEKFDFPAEKTITFWAHGAISKFLNLPIIKVVNSFFNDSLNSFFSAWALTHVKKMEPKEGWDAILCMSGVAEDLFLFYKKSKTLCVLHRGSTHIRDQFNILLEEKKRTGVEVELPTAWIIEREEREYELADLIRVQSPFSLSGFKKMAVPNEKLDFIPLGVNKTKFFATEEQVEKRIKRLKSGEKLKIVMVGNFSMQKGAWDVLDLLKLFPDNFFEIRHVGRVSPDAAFIAKKLKGKIHFVGKVPQDDLPNHYAWSDLFLLPSIQDGFAVVVSQALACRVPVLVSENTGSSFLINEGVNGWVFPIRSPIEISAILGRLNQNRELLVKMITVMDEIKPPKNWSEIALITALDLEKRTNNKIIKEV